MELPLILGKRQSYLSHKFKKCLKVIKNREDDAQIPRIELWKDENKQQVKEKLLPVHNNKLKVWRTCNPINTVVGQTKN